MGIHIHLLLKLMTMGLMAMQTEVNAYALLDVVSTGGSPNSDRYCTQYNSLFQHLPKSSEEAVPFDLNDFSQIEGCDPTEYAGKTVSSKHAIVGIMRGNCSFTTKAVVAQNRGASAVLVVDYKNSSSAPVPGGNKSEFHLFNISLATISWHDYNAIINLPGPVRVKLYDPPTPLWDGNMVFICFASTLIVIVAGGWAVYGEAAAVRESRLALRSNRSSNNRGEDADNKDEEEGDPFTVCGVIIWFCFISGTILLLYFFYDYMVYVFIALFCLVGAHSLYRCLLPAWTYIMPINYDIPLNRLPFVKSKAKLGSLLLLMPCLTLAIFWAVERHASFAWVLQDIMGVAFCINLIQSLRLPSLKIIGILLSLLLIYDVFFVFITPLMTSDGESVMESVATGSGHKSKESLPMVFLIPLFGSSPQYACRERAYSLLGFGDVIIPGLLVAYNGICDVRLAALGKSSQNITRGGMCLLCRLPYYLVAVVGYFVGMAVCMVSLVMMNSGQPALLYLVPCTLIPTTVLALLRREFCVLFHGQVMVPSAGFDTVESQVGYGESLGEGGNGSRQSEQGVEGNDEDEEMDGFGSHEEQINLIH